MIRSIQGSLRRMATTGSLVSQSIASPGDRHARIVSALAACELRICQKVRAVPADAAATKSTCSSWPPVGDLWEAQR